MRGRNVVHHPRMSVAMIDGQLMNWWMGARKMDLV
jgi:hypothetical protein